MTQTPHPPAPEPPPLYCPSAPAEPNVASVFAVVGGSAEQPRLNYLSEPQPFTPELAALVPDLAPEEVYRFTSPCAKQRCRHFTGSSCSLGAALVQVASPVSDQLPPCSIRTSCRWFKEQGAAACVRCPQVVTQRPMLSASETSKPFDSIRRLRVL